MIVKKALLFVACMALLGCAPADQNAAPIYGQGTGLPVNCRAYVQAAIDGYRNRQYTADEAMAGLERNCGINGNAWGQTK